MEHLTDDNNLEYTFDNEKIKITDFFNQNNISEKKIIQKIGNNYTIDWNKGLVKYKFKIEFDSFLRGINFNFIEKNVKGIFYSYKHLEELLKKYEYKNPFYCIGDSTILNPLKNIREIKLFQVSKNITIYEKEEPENIIDNIYKELETNNENKIVQDKDEVIDINQLTPNFKTYFVKESENMSKSKIPIYYSSNRYNIMVEIFGFINKDNQNKIYALCGPFGIGKSFTALLIQKILFFQKYPTIYVNLATNSTLDALKMIIIKELFFLIFDKNKYIDYSKKILNENINNLWELIIKIDQFCLENNINYLLILDQYQSNKDQNKQIKNLKTSKIFLLSSINDTDVKDNLISQITGNNSENSINYKYIISLFDADEIINPENLIIENKDQIISVLKMFNYLPVSIFLLEFAFNWNTLDFMNSQFCYILKKLSTFFDKFNIKIMSYLNSNKYINSLFNKNKKSIQKNYFINNYKDIPFKFIAYELYEPNLVNLSFAFDYIIYPFLFYLSYIDSILDFKMKQDVYMLGGKFEKIIQYIIILKRPLFNIDSFIEVDQIYRMNLVNEYKFIDIKQIKKKSNVFIFQEEYYGKDFDFALLKPKENTILLLQAKYRITSDETKEKQYYSEKNKIDYIIKLVKSRLDISLAKIYILYISSVEYNNSKVFSILESKRINCIFYNITDDYFTFNFKNRINELNLTPSYEIYPESKVYEPALYFKIKRIDQFVSSINEKQQVDLIKSEFKDYPLPLIKEQDEFLNYLKSCKINKSVIESIGPFVSHVLKDFSFYPTLYFDYYLLFFSFIEGNTIDYSKDLFLMYEESYNLHIYNLRTHKYINMENFKKNIADLHIIIGQWKKDNSLSLKEK